MKTALTIAGSDSGGGAGIQADIKTMMAHGVFAMSAITAVTAQNTVGVNGIMEVPADFLEKQLESVFEDIRPDAVKIGMVSTAAQAEVIGRILDRYHAEKLVLDPVMVATSGASLVDNAAMDYISRNLFKKASLVTPNIPESEVLSGLTIESQKDMEKAAEVIWTRFGAPVLVKGGHSVCEAEDYYYDGREGTWLRGERVDCSDTHGTGCTLSSAIASNLAQGMEMIPAIKAAKDYMTTCMKQGLRLGRGRGPLDHGEGFLKRQQP